MVAIHLWLPTGVMRNQSHSSLLQSGVTLCLCPMKHKQLITVQESGTPFSCTKCVYCLSLLMIKFCDNTLFQQNTTQFKRLLVSEYLTTVAVGVIVVHPQLIGLA